MVNVIDYVPGDTVLHRLNPIAKLALAAGIIIATFLGDTYPMLLGLLALTLVLGAYAGVFKNLLSLLKPSSGSVRVAGLDTREVPTSAIAARCATLFQNPDRQLCKDTVLEEVAFGLELQGVEAQEAKAGCPVLRVAPR